MTHPSAIDYSPLDVPEVLLRLFHPRPEFRLAACTASARDLLIPVADTVAVGARFHPAAAAAPTLLFFHGNGEIVGDYESWPPFSCAKASIFSRWIIAATAAPPAPPR